MTFWIWELHLPIHDVSGVATSQSLTFVGGASGSWRVLRVEAVAGDSLDWVPSVGIFDWHLETLPTGSLWLLRGVTSHERCVTRREHDLLAANQPALARPESTCAALIPVKKSAQWWELAQDERRAIFEERSKHTETGLKYLPAVARRLHHCRDLGEPFDFLTWFEYAPSDAEAFEELVGILRQSKEWSYVAREVDIRLLRK